VLGEFDAKSLNSDTGKTQGDNDAEKNSGDGNENSLFVRELEGMLGELEGVLGEFDTELLNSDTRETQVVNDAEKSSSDGNENSPKLRTSKLNKLVRALKTRRRKTSVSTFVSVFSA
jgi:porphobilinogen deaminase